MKPGERKMREIEIIPLAFSPEEIEAIDAVRRYREAALCDLLGICFGVPETVWAGADDITGGGKPPKKAEKLEN